MKCLALLGVLGSSSLLACSEAEPPPAASGLAGQSGGLAGAGGGKPNSAGGSSSGGSSGVAGSAEAAAGGSGAGGESSGAAGNAGTSACSAAPTTEAPTPTSCDAAPAGSPELAATALATVNDLRSKMGLPCMALISEINVSAQKHCDYYQQNIEDDACTANAHGEVSTCPGYVDDSFGRRMTKAGYTGSPRSEVMAFSGEPVRAIGQWINSVYHRTPLLSPWIADMGYGSTDDCDTIDMGLGPKAPDELTAVYPYPGQTGVPTSFDGSHEGPMPPEPPSGWPSASPIHLYIKGFTVQSHDVLIGSSCEPLTHQWLPEKDYYILYPDQPFTKATEYRVRIQGTKGGQPLLFDWSFTTAN
jgi:uncharacterized protein YkwD